jgi:hypothetical protein
MMVALWIGSEPIDAQRDQRMAAFVIGGELLFLVGHGERAAFRTHHDLVLSRPRTHCARPRRLPRRAASKAASFTRLAKICAREAGCAARDDLRVHIRRQRHLAHMDLENLLAAREIGIRARRSAGRNGRGAAARGRARRAGSVGRNQDHAFIRLEAVHLDQQLVERLLALVIAAAETAPR